MTTKKNVTLYDIDKYVAVLGDVASLNVLDQINISGSAPKLKIGAEQISTDDISKWNDTNTLLLASQPLWNHAYTTSNVVNTLSSNWQNTYTLSERFSATWDVIYDTTTKVDTMYTSSFDWNVLLTKEQSWDDTYMHVKATSGLWTAQDIEQLEVDRVTWDSTFTNVKVNSAMWSDTSSIVQTYSASWEESADINIVSADVAVLKEDRKKWDDTHNTVNMVSADWSSTFSSVESSSASWDSVYNYMTTASGQYGVATLGSDGKLDEQLVPNLSITDTHVVTHVGAVEDLCSGLPPYQNVNLETGDVVIVVGDITAYNLIALRNNPSGVYDIATDQFADFAKLGMPSDFLRSVNLKSGGNITLNPDDLDDSSTNHKFVTAQEKYDWNLTLSTWQTNSATSIYSYTSQQFVNVDGDSMTGDLSVDGTLVIGGKATFNDQLTIMDSLDLKKDATIGGNTTITGNVTIDTDLYVKGDATIDGNLILNSGNSGQITVGDTPSDRITFTAQVADDVIPESDNTHALGSESNRWSVVHVVTGGFESVELTQNLSVSGNTVLSGKQVEYEFTDFTEPDPVFGYDTVQDSFTGEYSQVPNGVTITTTLTSLTASEPGVILHGNPIGVQGTGSYQALYPDFHLDGDLGVTGALSANQAYIKALTAADFTSEYRTLVVRDGDLEIQNGSLIQTGGAFRIGSDISHIEDENTYIRFGSDQITLRCHDIDFIRLSEFPSLDDVVIVGDTLNPVDFRVTTPTHSHALFVDGATGFTGIGTLAPQTQFHMLRGEMQLASGSAGGALMIPTGDSAQRIAKTGSIRWNTETQEYEGYYDNLNIWGSLGSDTVVVNDGDEDTFITVDAEERVDTDRISMFTAGCSAITIMPNQAVRFAGEIEFDNIPVYDTTAGSAPMIETQDYIFLYVNGKRRALRLYDIPEGMDTSDNMSTIAGEHILDIGESGCATGERGNIPTQTISGDSGYYSRQHRFDDPDQDWLSNKYDEDDDGDGIPDFGDPDHPSHGGDGLDTDDDGLLDTFDPDDDNDGVLDFQDVDPVNAPGSGLWDPAELNIATVMLWLDASDQSSIEFNDPKSLMENRVETWTDLTGNSDVTQPNNLPYTAGYYEARVEETLQNGLQYITFDDTGHMKQEDGSFTPPTDGNMTVYVVAKVDAVDSGKDSLISYNVIDESGAERDFQLDAAKASGFHSRLNTTESNTGPNAPDSKSGWHVYRATFNYNLNKITLHVDDQQVGVDGDYNEKIDQDGAWIIFTNRNFQHSPSGEIGEMIVVNDVSDDTTDLVQGYLSHKWGLAGLLPTDHPYYDEAPVVEAQPSVGDHDGDHMKDEYDPDHILSHGRWDLAYQNWEDITEIWEALDGQP